MKKLFNYSPSAIFVYIYTVDLVIFHILEDLILRISRGQIREIKNLFIIKIALLKKNENLQILIFVKNPRIKKSRKFKHAKSPDLKYMTIL